MWISLRYNSWRILAGTTCTAATDIPHSARWWWEEYWCDLTEFHSLVGRYVIYVFFIRLPVYAINIRSDYCLEFNVYSLLYSGVCVWLLHRSAHVYLVYIYIMCVGVLRWLFCNAYIFIYSCIRVLLSTDPKHIQHEPTTSEEPRWMHSSLHTLSSWVHALIRLIPLHASSRRPNYQKPLTAKKGTCRMCVCVSVCSVLS